MRLAKNLFRSYLSLELSIPWPLAVHHFPLHTGEFQGEYFSTTSAWCSTFEHWLNIGTKPHRRSDRHGLGLQ